MCAPTTRAPVWALDPAALRALGYARDPRHLFGRFQRLETWDADGPVLSREARALAERSLDLSLPRIVEEAPSADGSTRLVLALEDGARIEAVHMPRAVRRPRVTVCLSSQVGCAMGCTFCATARMGLVRDLGAHEIVGQLFAVMRRYGPISSHQLSLVFMGMGEPLHNVDAVVRALDVLCDPAGLGVAPNRVTVSTAGHVAGLMRLSRARYLPLLAVSVNAASEVVRRRLMPIGKKWPLAELRAALDHWPRRPHQKITLEYVLLDGVNDDLESADRLAEWVGDLRHVLNVIPFNDWGSPSSPYRAPSEETLQRFVARLHERGCLVTVRRSRGRDVRGACGTLVAT
jgi:23S rRNA (adenine2503-C2)-methyltransferase